MIEVYKAAAKERSLSGIPPLPLSRQQVEEVVQLLEQTHPERTFLLELLASRV